MKITKTIKKLLLLTMSLSMIFVLASCSQDAKNAGKGEVSEINIGYLRVANDEVIAKQNKYIEDYFKQKDIKVNFLVVDSGVEANKAFASGSLDFASMGNTNAIVALSSGLDTELVWIHEVLGSIEALVVKKDEGIKTVADLKGKSIATTFSSTSHYILLNALREAGIENDVKLFDMQTTDIVAAWERGDIVAAYTWEPSVSKLLELNGKILIDSKDMAEKGFITANVALARKSFAQAHPDLIAGLLQQIDKGVKLYTDDKAAAIKAAATEIDLPVHTVEIQMSGSKWLGIKTQLSDDFFGKSGSAGRFSTVMHDTAKFLKEQHSIEKLPSKEEFDEFINPKYLELADEEKN